MLILRSVPLFIKMRLRMHENIGSGPIHLPKEELHTSSCFYDRYPGGIGLSERLYEVHDELIRQAKSLIISCTCLSGCPACVGTIEEVGLPGKEQALQLLEEAEGTR